MISAIILAAGESKRMGRPKMLLPWGADTVLGHVLSVLQAEEVEDIVVVTGGARHQVEAELVEKSGIRPIFNADYAQGGMLGSIQCGLASMKPEAQAALICLGDQPQIQENTVQRVCAVFREKGASLVVPSYRLRRGHPWLVARPLWEDLLGLNPALTPRDFLNSHAKEIEYVDVDTPSVIEDLDTPEDYRKYNPGEL